MLRLLAPHKALIAAGAVLALVVALVLMFRLSVLPPALSSRQQVSGLATASVIIAARNESTVDVGTQLGALQSEAVLLADRLATDDARAGIARTAGVGADQVAIIGPAMSAPPLQLPLARAATKAATAAAESYRLTVTTAGHLPIVSMSATGPDPVSAARVASAAATTLDHLAASDGTQPRSIVQRLGTPSQKTVTSDSPAASAIGGALLTFVLWCSAIILVSGAARGRRNRRWEGPSSRPSASTQSHAPR